MECVTLMKELRFNIQCNQGSRNYLKITIFENKLKKVRMFDICVECQELSIGDEN